MATLAGTSAIVTAKDGAAVADASQASTFMVDIECGNMIVASQAGMVELRSGGKAKGRRGWNLEVSRNTAARQPLHETDQAG